MKTLLVNTCLRPGENEKIIFPIGIGYIATAMKNANIDFDILDLDAHRMNWDEVREEVRRRDFDALAMGTIVTGYNQTKTLAQIVREEKGPDLPIIVGNTVATSIPDTLMVKTAATYGVMDEGDITIVDLIRTIERGGDPREVPGIFYKGPDGKAIHTEERPLIRGGQGKGKNNLDSLPHVDYTLLDMEAYLEGCRFNVTEPYPIPFEEIVALPINTARGCPFACTFCYFSFAERTMKDGRYRTRSIEDICDEVGNLQETYGVNYIQLFDELTLFNAKQADQFAQGILDSGLEFYWNADCRGDLLGDNPRDYAIAQKLKAAGCQNLGYSLESANPAILEAMDKRISVEKFMEQTSVLHRAGILPTTSVIVGYPTETPETIAETFQACYDANIYPSAGYLLPQPGTPMYNKAVEAGVIGKGIDGQEAYLMQMGDRQDLRVNLTKMSQKEMEGHVISNLQKISDKLGLGLGKGKLVKTGHYRQREGEERPLQDSI